MDVREQGGGDGGDRAGGVRPSAGQQHIGFQIANEPGSTTWNENLSRDCTENKAFLPSVLAYEYGESARSSGTPR